MSIFPGNPIDEELLVRLENDKNGRKIMPLVNLARKLTNDDPYLYPPFELYPIGMMRYLLGFLVEHFGLDKNIAKAFYTNHFAFVSPRLNIEEAIAFYGEERFDKMIDDIIKLAKPFYQTD